MLQLNGQDLAVKPKNPPHTRNPPKHLKMYSCGTMKEQQQQPGVSSFPPYPTHGSRTNQQARTVQNIYFYNTGNSAVQHSQNVPVTLRNAVSAPGPMSNLQSPAGSVCHQTTEGTFYSYNHQRVMLRNANTTISMQSANTGLPFTQQFYILGKNNFSNGNSPNNPGTTSTPREQAAHVNAVFSPTSYSGQVAQNHIYNQNARQRQFFPATYAPEGYHSNAVHSPSGQSLGVPNTAQKTQEYLAQPSSWRNSEPPAATSSSNSPHQQYHSLKFQARGHRLPAAAFTENGRNLVVYPANTQVLINSRAAGSSSGMSPTAGSSHRLAHPPPSFSQKHNTVQQSASRDVSVSYTQPAGEAASEGGALRAKQTHPHQAGQFLYRTPNTIHHFQEAPPQQSAGPKVPCKASTGAAPRSPTKIVLDNVQIPNKSLKSLQFLSLFIEKHCPNMKKHLLAKYVSGMCQKTGSPSSVMPNDGSAQAPPVCSGNRAVAVVPPQPLECLQEMSHSHASEKGSTSPGVHHVSPEISCDKRSSESTGSPVGGAEAANGLSASDSQLKTQTRISDQRVNYEPVAETPEEPRSRSRPEVQGEDASSSAASPGLSIASLLTTSSKTANVLSASDSQLKTQTCTSEQIVNYEPAAETPEEHKSTSRSEVQGEDNSSSAASSGLSIASLLTPSSKTANVLSASDSQLKTPTRTSEQSVNYESAAETPEEPRRSSRPEVQGEDDSSSAASSGLSIASLLTTSSKTVEETDVAINRIHLEDSPNLFFLKHDEVYKEAPYKSSWLNVNEQLDDIDKEFGFSWLLKYHDDKLESRDAETASPVSDTPAEMDEKTEASPLQDPSPQMSSQSDSDIDSSICRLDVLSPEVAKHIFERLESRSPVTLVMDEDQDTSSSLSSDVYDITPSMEKPAGSTVTEILHERFNIGGDGVKESCQEWVHGQKTPTLSPDNDRPDVIIISDGEDESASTGRDETDPDIIDDEELWAAPLEFSPSNSGDELTENEEEIQISVQEEDRESAQLKTTESTESPLETEAVQEALRNSVRSEKKKRRSSDETSQFTKTLKKLKKFVLGSQHVSDSDPEREEIQVDAADARPSSAKPETVTLMLFGSANRKQSDSYRKRKHSSSGSMSDGKAPKVISVGLGTSQAKPTEPLYMGQSSVKKRIHESWRESYAPTKLCHKSKLKSLSPESSKKKDTDDSSQDGVSRRKNLRCMSHRKRRVKKNKPELEKTDRTCFVSVKRLTDNKKSEVEVESQRASRGVKGNPLLKFSASPQTSSFKDESKRRTDAACPVSEKSHNSVKNPKLVKDQTNRKAVSEVKGSRFPVTEDSSRRHSVLKESSAVHEFQKKHRKNKQPSKDN